MNREKTLQHGISTQIQLTGTKCPVSEIFFLSWEIIFSLLDNYFFPTGQFWTPSFVRFCTFLPSFLFILGNITQDDCN